MIDRENFPEEQDPIPGQEDENTNPENGLDLETQEQINNENLVRRIEQENEDPDAEGSSITSDESMGIPAPSNSAPPGRAGEAAALRNAEIEANSDDRPTNKNLLGDNPPGREDIAFNSDHPGDITSDQVKYNAENIREAFRENIDKTSAEINLDKKLKDEEEND